MFKATLGTRHFNFEAYGQSEREAKQILLRGCQKHCKQAQVSFTVFKEEYADDICTYEIKIGVSYRDQEEI